MTQPDLQAAIVDRIERYLETWRSGDIGAGRRLFAPTAVIEDPVGAEPLAGLEEIVRSWNSIASEGSSFEPELRGVIVSGREALVMFMLQARPVHGRPVVTENFAVFEFDAAMEIRRLRFYRDDTCLHLGQ